MRFTIRRSWVLPLMAGAGALLVITAGAAAAVETATVTSFGRGLWWATALMTTVGFVGTPPRTAQGEALSVVLMVAGFFLLALVSAALASLFVREDEQGAHTIERAEIAALMAQLQELRTALAAIESQLGERGRPEPYSRPRASVPAEADPAPLTDVRTGTRPRARL